MPRIQREKREKGNAVLSWRQQGHLACSIRNTWLVCLGNGGAVIELETSVTSENHNVHFMLQRGKKNGCASNGSGRDGWEVREDQYR